MLNVFKYLSGWRSRTWFLLIALAAAISPIMPLPLIIIIFLAIGTLAYVSDLERIPTIIPAASSGVTVVRQAPFYGVGERQIAREFAFIDLETTGLHPEEGDRIIEIAILITDASYNEISRYETLVNPLRQVAATHIHLIHDDMLTNAPTIKDINSEIVSLLNGRLLVAHNAKFEQAFLNNELTGITFDKTNFLDTLELSRIITPIDKHSLSAISEFYGVKYENAHSALGDVLILRQVLSKMFPIRQNTNFIVSPVLNAVKSEPIYLNVLQLTFSKWLSREQAKSKLESSNATSNIAYRKISEYNEVKEYVPNRNYNTPPPWWRTMTQKGEVGLKLISKSEYKDVIYEIIGTTEYWEGKPKIMFTVKDGREMAHLVYNDKIIADMSANYLAERPWIKDLAAAGKYRVSIFEDMGLRIRLFFKP